MYFLKVYIYLKAHSLFNKLIKYLKKKLDKKLGTPLITGNLSNTAFGTRFM